MKVFNSYIGKYISLSKLINKNSNVYKILDAKIIQRPLFPVILFKLEDLSSNECFWVETLRLQDYCYADNEDIQRILNKKD